MDLTDGLALDLHRMCVASHAAAQLDRIPLVRASSVEQALHGGEDYELLFTAPPNAPVPKGMHRIGTIVEGAPGEIRWQGGDQIDPRGYDHFRNR